MASVYTRTLFTSINANDVPDTADAADQLGETMFATSATHNGFMFYEAAGNMEADILPEWRDRVGRYKVTVTVEYVEAGDE